MFQISAQSRKYMIKIMLRVVQILWIAVTSVPLVARATIPVIVDITVKGFLTM